MGDTSGLHVQSLNQGQGRYQPSAINLPQQLYQRQQQESLNYYNHPSPISVTSVPESPYINQGKNSCSPFILPPPPPFLGLCRRTCRSGRGGWTVRATGNPNVPQILRSCRNGYLASAVFKSRSRPVPISSFPPFVTPQREEQKGKRRKIIIIIIMKSK